jgi:hypothetical protein
MIGVDLYRGTIAYIYSIDHRNGKKMLEQFNKIAWGFGSGRKRVEKRHLRPEIPLISVNDGQAPMATDIHKSKIMAT